MTDRRMPPVHAVQPDGSELVLGEDGTVTRSAHCRSCGAPIVFGTNVSTRKPMPVDAEPSEVGNISRYDAADGPRFVVLARSKAAAMRAQGVALYLSHFASCPNAAQWRKESQ